MFDDWDPEETGLDENGDEYDADYLDDPNEPSITPDEPDWMDEDRWRDDDDRRRDDDDWGDDD